MKPAPPSTTARTYFGPAVPILEADHVVQLGRRGLEDVAVGLRDHPVPQQRRDVEGLAGAEELLLQRLALAAGLEEHLPLQHVDGLVLAAVVLQARGRGPC